MDEAALRRQAEQYYENRSEFIIHFTVFAIINVVVWAIWAFLLNPAIDAGWPLIIPLTITLGWSSGLFAHGIEVRSKHPQRFKTIEQTASAQMAALYGDDWALFASEDDFTRLYKAGEKRLRHHTEFAIHLVVYLTINLLLWLLWAVLMQSSGFPLPLVVTGMWGAGLAAHGVSNYFQPEHQILAREQAIQQAMGAEPKKKKRLDHARSILTDDGELLEVIDETQEENLNEQQNYVL